jgi:CRP-like cAMP-binding protein
LSRDPNTLKMNGDYFIDTSNTPDTNHLLAALPAAAFRRLLPDLEQVTLETADSLLHAPGRPQFAYFPAGSIVTLSYAIEADGSTAKAAWSVGREGMVGISLFLGNLQRGSRADVEFGGVAYRLPGSALLAEFHRADAFQKSLLRYVSALVTQASQISICSLYHSAEQRLCRYLTLAFERVGGTEISITQARIAMLLGVRREAITEVEFRLQQAGIIKYSRGHITLVNSTKLAKRACACCGIIRRALASTVDQ